MPEYRRIALADIDEPQTPARIAMDDVKLDELTANIAANGLLQPIGVKQADLRYEIEYGHRRFICVTRLGWKEVPALVYAPGELKEGAAMLAENIYREELSAAEEALLFADAQERYKLDEAGLMARFHISADYLGDRMRLLRGDQKIFEALANRFIGFSVARELNKCTDEPHRRYLLDLAVRGGCTAVVAASWVRQWKQELHSQSTNPVPPTPAAELPPSDPYRLECVICGGFRDPYNLVNVHIHKHELDQIKRALTAPPEEEPCTSTSPATDKAS